MKNTIFDEETKSPIICLLTYVTERDNDISFGSIDAFCKELAVYSQNIGVFFYVTSIHTFNKNSGYVFENGEWKKSTVPSPDVIHNRIHSRKEEQSDLFKEFLEKLRMQNIPIFNDHFLNKWEVHNILEQNEYLHPYLPDTKLFTHKNDLYSMLEIHHCVFLKPVHGSQGRKIFRVGKEGFDYYLDYTTFTGEIETFYQNFTALFQAIKSRIKNEAYIIQRCLPLLKYKEKPLDFRILCQKQEDEKWKITSAIARISSKDQFVSNLARGGEIMKVNEVLSDSFEPTTIPHIKKIMQEISLEVCSVIEQFEDGIYAELGVDLALDNEGKPSVIEVNTKPSKNMDSNANPNLVRPSARAIIHHCIYLANLYERREVD